MEILPDDKSTKSFFFYNYLFINFFRSVRPAIQVPQVRLTCCDRSCYIVDDCVNILTLRLISLSCGRAVAWQTVRAVSSWEKSTPKRIKQAALLSVFQMTVGLCVCAVLAVLCSSCFGLPFSPKPVDEDQRYFSVPSEGTRARSGKSRFLDQSA